MLERPPTRRRETIRSPSVCYWRPAPGSATPARTMSRLLALATPIALLVGTAGCTGTTTTTSTIATTLITIRPELFVGAVRCRPGELRSYVVTLVDVSVSPPLVLPSSTGLSVATGQVGPSLGPSPCTKVVYFGEPTAAGATEPTIVAGHYYTGQIDGYDQEGLTAARAGDRTLVTATGDAVARWTTTCGVATPVSDAGTDADEAGSVARLLFGMPTLVVEGVSVDLAGCIPFSSSDDAGTDAALPDDSALADQSVVPDDGALADQSLVPDDGATDTTPDATEDTAQDAPADAGGPDASDGPVE
jgi:hypothetical protein